MSINQYERKVSSQNGEDGIIAEILNRIGTTNKFFVEFGADYGIECNTAVLIRAGWKGLMIEADPSRHLALKSNYIGYPVITRNEFITAENIADIFRSADVPTEFDLLSIDIDGNDYWAWKALAEYKPRVVVIEYNCYYVPPQKWVLKYNPTHEFQDTTYYGASLTSLAILGEQLGYSLVGTESRGVNAFFIRNDELEKSGFKKLTPKEAYHPAGYWGLWGQPGHRPVDGEHEEI